MSIEAMRQALEALAEINKLSIGENAICLPAEIDTAMDALRQAIEQAERASKRTISYACPVCCASMIEQAEQAQPVAWRTFDGEGGYDYRDYDMNEDYAQEWAKRNPLYVGWVEPLYTAPPQRQPLTDEEIMVNRAQKPWVGLTKQDVYDLFNKMIAQEGNNIDRRYQDFAKYLEAKLKEKNCG